MARQPRFVLVGHPQHIIIRGNNREPIFYADEDYRYCLDKLQQACVKHHCDVHAYVLMTNHVHLLITPQKTDGLSKALQMLGRYYVQYFNYTYERTGTLWEGRYKASLVDSDSYALVCYRYIELNPTRAGMVNHPSDYPWSSYRHNACGECDSLVMHHPLYETLGISDAERQKAYRLLFRSRIADKTLDEIRSSTNKAWVLGNSWFKEEVERTLNRPVSPRPRGGDRKSRSYRERG